MWNVKVNIVRSLLRGTVLKPMADQVLALVSLMNNFWLKVFRNLRLDSVALLLYTTNSFQVCLIILLLEWGSILNGSQVIILTPALVSLIDWCIMYAAVVWVIWLVQLKGAFVWICGVDARVLVFKLCTVRDDIIAAMIEIRHWFSEHARDEIPVRLIYFILDYALFIFSIWNLVELNIEGALRILFILVSLKLILVFLQIFLLVATVFHNVVLVFLLINTINNFHVVEFVSDCLVMRDWDNVR